MSNFTWTDEDRRAVDTARVLAADAVQKVGNGHPGTAISLAPVAYLLYQKVMNTDPELFWEAHRVGTRQEYCHIEQLANLDSLPPSGFKVAVFPLKIMGASGAPARVVAIFEE